MRAINARRHRRQLRELLYFQGGEPRFTLDPAIDPKIFPADRARRSTRAFRASDRVPAGGRRAPSIAASRSGRRRAANAGARLAPDPAGPRDLDADPRDIGSNNWVVAGSRTHSTRPILANDPHRVIAAPSLRYWVHLVAPGWNVIGGGEPVLPGVSIGHNEHGAWGLTIFGTRQRGPLRLRHQSRQPERVSLPRQLGSDARRSPTRSRSRASSPKPVELKYTRHGPVLFEDRANRKAYALRAGWMEPGGAPYLASLRMNQATTWEEFRAACTFSHMPSENMVWVDRQGTIGWQAAGIQPLRRNWSGLLPVPGDGRYEWDGYLPIASLPSRSESGARLHRHREQLPVARRLPLQGLLHCTWSDPFRASRIAEVLGSGRLFSVGRDDAAAERRPVDRRARADAAAARRDARQSGERRGRAIC